MEDKKKNLIYETPSIDVMELKYDAVLCMSNLTGNEFQPLGQYTTPSDPDPFDF